MTLAHLTKINLQKDKHVLGKAWLKTYGGFFGNKKHMEAFVKTVIPFIPKKEKLRILYVASAQGTLGEMLSETVRQTGSRVELTITDASQKHLKENKNKQTQKVLGDLLKLSLPEKYDVIIMRSSLDYFHTEKLQIKLLKRISKWLSPKGILINQACSLENKQDRDTADKIYSSSNKIGKRHFQCEEDIGNIYKKAGLSLKKIGEGPTLNLSEKDHVERYKITQKEGSKIQEIICVTKAKTIKVTKTGYKMKFILLIYLSTKRKNTNLN